MSSQRIFVACMSLGIYRTSATGGDLCYSTGMVGFMLC